MVGINAYGCFCGNSNYFKRDGRCNVSIDMGALGGYAPPQKSGSEYRDETGEQASKIVSEARWPLSNVVDDGWRTCLLPLMFL